MNPDSKPTTSLLTIGLIGGMSWESTVPYYQHINQAVRQQLGGLHSARIVLYSVDFHGIAQLQRDNAWDEAGRQLASVAQKLEAAGADLLVLCTNTMHKVADMITAATNIPLLHIADPTAAAIRQAGMQTVGLLGTRFTMEQTFYRDRMQQHGIAVLVPDTPDRDIVHRVIYKELCQGLVHDSSRREYQRIIKQLKDQGAQAVILGCTEISLLIGPEHAVVPLFDTTRLHAYAAASMAMASNMD